MAPVFTPEQEREIRDHVLHLTKMFFEITKAELCQLVFKYAEKNNVRHNFNKDKQKAGADWYRNDDDFAPAENLTEMEIDENLTMIETVEEEMLEKTCRNQLMMQHREKLLKEPLIT